jgi:hypothetical protein
MEVVEKENKELKNVLPQVYGKANLDKTSLGFFLSLSAALNSFCSKLLLSFFAISFNCLY